MRPEQEIAEAPFGSRRGLLGGLVATAAVLGLLVVIDVLPRLDPPPPKVEGQPFVPEGVAGADMIEVIRGRKEFRLERAGDAWEILDHGERAVVADDRVEEFLKTLGELVVLVDIGSASELSLEDFGLSEPRDRIALTGGAAGEIRIRLGDRNPPLTGVYALVLPGEQVVLVGAVLLLEADKLAALASSRAPQ